MAFQGPFQQPQKSDIYEQLIEELGTVIAWQFKLDQWQQADFDESGLTDPEFQDQPASLNDIYWSSGIKYVHDGDTWVNQNSVTPPAEPPTQYPIAPEFPDNPTDGDTWTDPITGDVWYWWDDRWQTKPEPGEGGGAPTDVYTYDVITDETEKADLADVLRVIPDLDLTQLDTQKDVNWAISNAIDALDTQVDQNSGRLDDLTVLVPGARYLYEPASTYPRPPQTGKFYLGNGFTFTDVFGDVTQIMIHHRDHTGTEHTLENVNIGDSIIIEHDLDAQNFGRYQVTEVFHNFDDSIITVEVVSHRGSVEALQTYDVLAFPDVNVSDKPSYDYVDQGLASKVNRTGGDSMEGPLNISTQPGIASRDSRRVNTLGVYSNSTNSSLQLGTNNTKIYVGNNDTSFNGPIKVSEIADRGAGINIDATLKFNQHTDLLDIVPQNGTTQNINLFGPNSTGTKTILKVNINGATFNNAIEFESGPSTGKEVVLRIDSNRGLRARNLNMDNTKITKLSDPTDPDDATNKAYVDGAINNTFVEKAGDTMTGKLTTQNQEVKGELLLNSADRNINAKFGVSGKLQYDGFTKLQWGNTIVTIKGKLNIADGVDYLNNPITGQIDMNNKFIKNLANPTDSQHAATKYYVDARVKTWPGRRFTFMGYGNIGSALGPGIWSPSSNNTQTDIIISVEDQDGMRINQASPDYTPGVTLTMTVYSKFDETWRAVGFGVYGGTQTDFRSDHIKLTGFEWKQKPTLTNNITYALHVGSMW